MLGHDTFWHMPLTHDVVSHKLSGVQMQPGAPGRQPPTVQTRALVTLLVQLKPLSQASLAPQAHPSDIGAHI